MTADSAPVYRLVPVDGYEWALPVDDDDFERFRDLDGRASVASWSARRMALLRDGDGTSLQRAELPWLAGNVIVLRDDAVETVGALLEPFGALLPLVCDDARLAVFSADSLGGALDESASEIVRFSSGGILDLVRPAFHSEVIVGVGAFRLADMPRGDVYLAGDLVEAIRRTGHTSGTDFLRVTDP
ncbi:MAG: hypothetical protein ACRCZP_07510 [Phycicoccus sp.]